MLESFLELDEKVVLLEMCVNLRNMRISKLGRQNGWSVGDEIRITSRWIEEQWRWWTSAREYGKEEVVMEQA
jgi:hypothetical protein